MEYIIILRDYLVEGMKMQINVYGFTFSWWEVFVFDVVAGLLAGFIMQLLFDD